MATENTRGLALGGFAPGFCRPEYLAEIDHLETTLKGARAVLALGAVALWATTGLRKLTDQAGLQTGCRLAAVSVIPTYHPAYIGRGNYALIPAWHRHMHLAITLAT